MAPHVCGCFSVNMHLALHIPKLSTSSDSTNCSWKTVFSICRWESMNVEGPLCAVFYAVLCKGLGHPWILVPPRVWNQSPADPEGWLGSQKSYVDFGLCRGPAPQARAVQGRTVHPLYDSGHSLDPTVHPLHIPASFFLNYIQWWRWTESTPKKGTDAVPIKLYFITFMTLALSSNLGLLITLPHLR